VNVGAEGAIRGIAFDWGGVFTVGTFDARANARLANLYGIDAQTLWPQYLDLMEIFEVGGFDFPTFIDRLSRTIGRDVNETAFREAFLDAPLERPSMYTLLAGIPSEYAVGMLSNNVPVLCDRVREDSRTARVEKFIFSNEIGARKPDATAFMALAEAMLLPAHHILFVDDAQRNIDAAHALGFHAILLDTPAGFAAAWRAMLPSLAHLVDGPAWGADAA
jgi:putative hydrolase of the HAD superfamily